MAAADFFDRAQELYIAYYQRPADPAGLRFWAEQIEANGGRIGPVIDSFGNSPEALQLYGVVTAQNIGDVIDSIYQGLFGRDADAGGKAFWTDKFLRGELTPAAIAIRVLDAAKNNDAITIANKVAVANDFTQIIDGRELTDPEFGGGGTSQFEVNYSGAEDAQAARDFLSDISFTPESVPTPSETVIFVFDEIADNPGAREVLTLKEATETVTGTTITVIPGETTDPEFIITTLDPIITKQTYWISSENGEGIPLDEFANSVLFDAIFLGAERTFSDIQTIINVFNDSLARIDDITFSGQLDPIQGGDGSGAGNGGNGGNGQPGGNGGNGASPDGPGGDGGDGGDGGAGGNGDASGEAAEGKEGDFTGNYEITVSLEDGTAYSAVLELSESQFEFLNNLLFDADGNIRFEERDVEVYSYMPLLARDPETGELVLWTTENSGADDDLNIGGYLAATDVNGDLIPVKAFDVQVIEGETDDPTVIEETFEREVNVPIRLTTTENNDATVEPDLPTTSSIGNVIVAGRLELLHQAFIDAGQGYNILEVDAKGTYAQPLGLININEVRIENLPNVYTGIGEQGGNLGNSSYPSLADSTETVSTADAINFPATGLITIGALSMRVKIEDPSVQNASDSDSYAVINIAPGTYTAAELVAVINEELPNNIDGNDPVAELQTANGNVTLTANSQYSEIIFLGDQAEMLGLTAIAVDNVINTPANYGNSILDLSRALDLEKIVVTEGTGTEIYSDGLALGPLNVVGIRNGATARLEGSFTRPVTLNYSEGRDDDLPLTVELVLGEISAPINIEHNTDSLQLVSLGGGSNTFVTGNLGAGTLSDLIISGNARLDVLTDLDSSFQDTTPVSIDASENTGGTSLRLSNSDKVTFTGSQGNDYLYVATGDLSEFQTDPFGQIEFGGFYGGFYGDPIENPLPDPSDFIVVEDMQGDNQFELRSYDVTATTGDGDDDFEIFAWRDATVTAGDGDSNAAIMAQQRDASFTAGDGDIELMLLAGRDADVTTGDGEGNYQIVGARNVDVATGAGQQYFEIAGGTTVALETTDGDKNIEIGATDSIDNTTVGVATIAAGDGNNTLSVQAGAVSSNFGSGNSSVEVETIQFGGVFGDGNNTVDVRLYDSPQAGIWQLEDSSPTGATIALGNGANTVSVLIDPDTLTAVGQQASPGEGHYLQRPVVNITAGDGGNTISVPMSDEWANFPRTESESTGGNATFAGGDALAVINITTGGGDDRILAGGAELNISSGGGSDDITLLGLDSDYTQNGATGDSSDGALVNIDTGAGSSVVRLGASQDEAFLQTGSVTAKEGSVITGEDITLVVNTEADMRAATLSGISSVVLDDDAFDYANTASQTGEATSGSDTAVLTLTVAQYLAIGPENFSVEGSAFNTYSQIKLIVSEDDADANGNISFADLGVDDLAGNIDLQLELNDGVVLQVTAEELHTRVAPGGITLTDDNRDDFQDGQVLITDAGVDFDPFNESDTVRSIIDGRPYYGGSLSDDFYFDANNDGVIQRSEWGNNVLVDRSLNGYNRPADDPSFSRLTINTDDQGGTIGPFETIETFLRITGDSDLAFVPSNGGLDEWGRPIPAGSSILLGFDSDPGSRPDFLVDFSSATGSITNLTFGEFERAAGVFGNGSPANPARVNVEITALGSVSDASSGLSSQGVQQYVVTDIDGANDLAISYDVFIAAVADYNAAIAAEAQAQEMVSNAQTALNEFVPDVFNDIDTVADAQAGLNALLIEQSRALAAVNATQGLVADIDGALTDTDGVVTEINNWNLSSSTTGNVSLSSLTAAKASATTAADLDDGSELEARGEALLAAINDYVSDIEASLVALESRTVAGDPSSQIPDFAGSRTTDDPDSTVDDANSAPGYFAGLQVTRDVAISDLSRAQALVGDLDNAFDALGDAEEAIADAVDPLIEAYDGFRFTSGANLPIVSTADAVLSQQGEVDAIYAANEMTAQFWTSNPTQGLEVLGLQGNYYGTITFGNTRNGVEFLLETEFDKYAEDNYSVGTLDGRFAAPGASAVVNIVALDAVPDGSVQRVAGINLTNARSIEINIEGGDTLIEDIDAAGARSLSVVADGDVTIDEQLPGSLESMTFDAVGDVDLDDVIDLAVFDDLEELDASDVAGAFDVALTGTPNPAAFAFSASAGETTLTLIDVDANIHSSFTAVDAATFTIVTDGNVDLASATLTGVDAIAVGVLSGAISTSNSSTVVMSQAQVDAIGESNIGLGHPGLIGTVVVSEFGNGPLDTSAFGPGLMVGLTTAPGDVVLDSMTDLSNVASFDMSGTDLTMTAEQAVALIESLVATGITDPASLFSGDEDSVLNIVDLTQDIVDFEIEFDGDMFSFTQILQAVNANGWAGEVTLAESVDIPLTDPDAPLGFDFNVGDGMTLGLGSAEQADGLTVNGTGDTTLQLNFSDGDGSRDNPFVELDASNYSVSTVRVRDSLITDRNIDSVLQGLDQEIVKEIFNVLIEQVDQTVTITQGAIIQGAFALDILDPTIELSDIILNLEGGVLMDGGISLAVTPAAPGVVQTFLNSLTINSNGTDPNPVTGEVANIIDSFIVASPRPLPVPGDTGVIANTLLDVTINAEQELQVRGIQFESGPAINDAETAELLIQGAEPVTVGLLDISSDSVDALNVVNNSDGLLTVGVSSDGTDVGDTFSFTSTGTGTGGTGEVALVGVGDGVVDLSESILDAVVSVVIEPDATLEMTIAQALAIQPENFSGDGTLALDQLGEEPFSPLDFINLTNSVQLGPLTVIAQPVVALDDATNLTGVSELRIPEGTVLNVSGAQLAQMALDGVTITGVNYGTDAAPDIRGGTINVTDASQADIDAVEDYVDAGGTAFINITDAVTQGEFAFASDISLPSDLAGTIGEFTFLLDTFTVTLADTTLADGVDFVGDVGSTIQFTDNAADASIDASGFDVDFLRINSVFASDSVNIDADFTLLPERVTKVIYLSTSSTEGRRQDVVVEEGVTVTTGVLGFNELNPLVEVTDFQLTLEGGVELQGDVVLNTVLVNFEDDGNPLANYLDEVTIVSVGTGANFITNDTTNIIDGDITPAGDGTDTFDNNLKTVTITADQELVITGDVLFSSHGDDTAAPLPNEPMDNSEFGENNSAVATLTVFGSSDVTIGGVNTADDDVDSLIINNAGAGALFTTIDASKIDDEPATATAPANIDSLAFTGNNISLRIVGSVNLSDDNLEGVVGLTLDDGSALTLTQAQADAITPANIVVLGTNVSSATLNLNEFGDDAFDATAYDSDIDIVTITMASGDHTLNGNFTGVDQIVVQEGDTLNLTAEQYQQLVGIGGIKIRGTDTNGDGTTAPITVNITDLMQTDVDDLDPSTPDIVFDATGVAATDTLTVALGESVEMSSNDILTNIDTLFMSDGQVLGLNNSTQADGLSVEGTGVTTVAFRFLTLDGADEQIDASGYNITTLEAIDRFFLSARPNAGQANAEFVIDGLSGDVVLVVYNDPEILSVAAYDRRVVIQENSAVPNEFVFNDQPALPGDAGRELLNLTITFEGNASIGSNDGGSEALDLRIPSAFTPDQGAQFLQQLNLISNAGSEPSTNTIFGDVTAQPDPTLNNPVGGIETVNRLDDVTISGNEDFEITGCIIFSDPADRDTGTTIAELNVSNDGDTTITGGLDTASDSDIVGLNISNTGGTLTTTLDAAKIDDDDVLTFTGGNIELFIEGAVSITNDDIGVGEDVIDAVTLNNGATLTLTQAQYNEIADGLTIVDGETATLVITDFDPAVEFDASAIADGITVASLMLANSNPFNGASDLTDVGSLIAPEDGTVTLSSTQFLQLAGDGVITGAAGETDYNVVITGLVQDDVTVGGITLVGITALGRADMGVPPVDGITVRTAESLNLPSENTGAEAVAGTATVLGGVPGNVTFELEDGHILGLGDIGQLSPVTTVDPNTDGSPAEDPDVPGTGPVGLAVAGTGLEVRGGTDTALELQFAGAGITLTQAFTTDGSGIATASLRLLDTLVDNQNIESIQYLAETVDVVVFESLADMNLELASISRNFFVEEGVTIDGFVAFNDLSNDSEVVFVNVNLLGDATINGTLSLTTVVKDPALEPNFFDTLTINSLGALPNEIDGDITPIAPPTGGAATALESNSLGTVIVNATADFSAGTVVFNSVDDDDATATLMVTGPGVTTLAAIDTTDPDITAYVEDVTGGTLIITGASPSGELNNTESMTLTGDGATTYGVGMPAAGEDNGIDGGGELSLIDASDKSGDLTIMSLDNVDSADFTFLSGSGVNTVTLDDVDFDSSNPAMGDPELNNWVFDFASAPAAPMSSLTLTGRSDWTDGGNLTVALGDNANLNVAGDTDFTTLADLSITGTGQIVLSNGAILTLTAEQLTDITDAGVTIVGNGDMGNTVNVIGLDNLEAPDRYDFSAVVDPEIAGTIMLANGVNDVTLGVDSLLGPDEAGSALGAFDIVLEALNDGTTASTELAGQTIRFATRDQAERPVLVTENGGTEENSSNVVWLFEDALDPAEGPIDTSGYFSVVAPVYQVGRLWLNQAFVAANNGLVEEFFTTLPTTVLRLEFDSLTDLDVLLAAAGFDRVFEFVSFSDNSGTGLVFDDLAALSFIESLEVRMGGQVFTGDITIGDVVDPTVNPATVIGLTTLILDSRRALVTDDLLAPEGFINDNDGLNENLPGLGVETLQPNNLNTVGDIGVTGTNDGIELLLLEIDTGNESFVGDGSVGQGADLAVGTVTFHANGPLTTNQARVRFDGANDATVASLNTDNIFIDSITVGLAATSTGNFNAPGASAGAAVSNTEEFRVNNLGTGVATFGTAGEDDKPGVSGADLSLIDIDGTGDVHLGVIGEVDGAPQAPPADPSDPTPPSFFLDASSHTGVASATLGNATFFPTLQDGGFWNVTNGGPGNGTLNLTITDNAVLGAGEFAIRNTNVIIQGDVDFTTLTADDPLTPAVDEEGLRLSGSTNFFVPAGQSVKILAEDANGVTFTGGGLVDIVGGQFVLDADLSNIMTGADDTGTVKFEVDTADGADGSLINGMPLDLAFTGELGVAEVTVTGDGSLDVQGATLDSAPRTDAPTTFVVEAGATLIISPTQASEDGAMPPLPRSVTGEGVTEITDIGVALDPFGTILLDGIDFSGVVTTGGVNIAVDTDAELFTGDDLGMAMDTRVTTIAGTATLTAPGTVVDGQYINGPGGMPAVTSDATLILINDDSDPDGLPGAFDDVPVSADLQNVAVETILFPAGTETGTITYPVLYGDPDEKYDDLAAWPLDLEPVVAPATRPVVQTVIFEEALQASDQAISGEATASGPGGEVRILSLDALDASVPPVQQPLNLLGITAGVLNAFVDSDVDLNPASELGTFAVRIEDGFTFTLEASQATGRVITDDVAPADGSIVVNALEDTPDADLSLIDVFSEVANLDADGSVIMTAILAPGFIVNVTDSDDTTTPNQVDFTGGTFDGSRTIFNINDAEIQLVFDAEEANGLTVNDNAPPPVAPATMTGTRVTVENVGGAPLDLGDIEGETLIANVPADATLFAGQTVPEVIPATDLGDFTVNLAEGVTLTLSNEQLLQAGPDDNLLEMGDFTSEGDGTTFEEILNVTDWDATTPIDTSVMPAGLAIVFNTAGPVGVTPPNEEVTVDPASIFTGVEEIVIPAGITLNMSADQYQQIQTSATVTGAGTLNLTGFDQDNSDIDMSTVEAMAGTITLDRGNVVFLEFDGDGLTDLEFDVEIPLGSTNFVPAGGFAVATGANTAETLEAAKALLDAEGLFVTEVVGNALSVRAIAPDTSIDLFVDNEVGAASQNGSGASAPAFAPGELTEVAGEIAPVNPGSVIVLDAPDPAAVPDPIVGAILDTLTGDKFEIVLPLDNQGVTLSSETQADGRVVRPEDDTVTGTRLVLGFDEADGTDADANLEAAGFLVNQVYVLNTYLQNEFGGAIEANIPQLLSNYPSFDPTPGADPSFEVVIFDDDQAFNANLIDPAAISTVIRQVRVETNTTVNAGLAFNDLDGDGDPTNDAEVTDLTLVLQGNSVINGNIKLDQDVDPNSVLPENRVQLFKTLTIVSEDVNEGPGPLPTSIGGALALFPTLTQIVIGPLEAGEAITIGGYVYVAPAAQTGEEVVAAIVAEAPVFDVPADWGGSTVSAVGLALDTLQIASTVLDNLTPFLPETSVGTASGGPNTINGNILANDNLGSLDSTVATFTLDLDPLTSIGAGEQIAFDGQVVALPTGGDVDDLGAALEAAGYSNWSGTYVPGVAPQMVFTNITAGVAGEVDGTDFAFTANDGGTVGLPFDAGDVTFTQGAFAPGENNLFDVAISASHDLDITGVLELSYVAGTQSILSNFDDVTIDQTVAIVNIDTQPDPALPGSTVNITSVNFSDADITDATINAFGSGTVNAPGTNPAGFEAENTNSLVINAVDADTTINLGSATQTGVSGSELTLIDINRPLETDAVLSSDSGPVTVPAGTPPNGTVNLGTIDSMSGDAFVLQVNPEAGADSIASARIGAQPGTPGAVGPTLNDGGVWEFYGLATANPLSTPADGMDMNPDNNLNLTIDGSTTLGAGHLILEDVNLTIEGSVDLGTLLSFETTDVVINVAAGAELTMSYDLAVGLDIVGEGTLNLVGPETATDSASYRGLQIENINMIGVDPDPTITLDPDTNPGFYDIVMNTRPIGFPAPPVLPDVAVSQTIVGSDFRDNITTAFGDDTVTGGAGSDRIQTDGGMDTIFADEFDFDINGGSGEDTVVFSGGVNETMENLGDAALNAVEIIQIGDGGGVFDFSVQTEGFDIIGSAVSDTISGSGVAGDTIDGGDGDDVINGGNDAWVPGTDPDVLTGGTGGDLFEFNISISEPVAVVATVDTDGNDDDVYDLTAPGADDDGNGQIVIFFRNNNTTGNIVIADDATIDFTNSQEVGDAIVAGLGAEGIAAAYADGVGAADGQITLDGAPGQAVEITSSLSTDGTYGLVKDGAASGTPPDEPEVATVTVGDGTPGDVTVVGERYTLTVTPSFGDVIEVNVLITAEGTESELRDLLRDGLLTQLGDAALEPAPNYITVASVGINGFSLTSADPENGGFTVDIARSGGVDGTGASRILVGNNADLNTTDIITDFATGEDTVTFGGLAGVAGPGGNFASDAAIEASYALAYADAVTAMGLGATYYLGFIEDDLLGNGPETVGVLFFDANNDDDPDGVVALVGIDPVTGFDAADIVA